jgi:Neuraminidase (sialidase)
MKRITLLLAAMAAATLMQAQWQPDVRLTNASGSSSTSQNNAWCVAASGDTVHVTWSDRRDGNDEIYYKRSADRGVTWGPDTRLTNDTAESLSTAIPVNGHIVHIVWFDKRDANYELYYKRSDDAGTTWGPDLRLTDAPGGSVYPAITVEGQAVHVAWQDERDGNDGEIYYKHSQDGGVNWSPDDRLTNDPDYSGIPSVVAKDNVVHIAWEDYRHQNGDIFYKRSGDGGATWSADLRLTTSSADQWDPALALQGQKLYLVWMDARNTNYEIYTRISNDGGLTWEADERRTNAAGDSKYPSIAVSGTCIHLAWQDKRSGNYEIRYPRSVDGGITWEADTALTNAPWPSEFVSVALSDSVVHAVWQDSRDMNVEIYYKRNPAGNVPYTVGTLEIQSMKNPLMVFPNPASSQIIVHRNAKLNDPAMLKIIDMLGNERRIYPVKGNAEEFSLDGLENGLYFLFIESGGCRSASRTLVVSQ